MQLTERDNQRLKGVHPDLVKIINQAVKNGCPNFTITEGLRTLERQKQLLKEGSTTTLKSRHLTGHAFDFAPLDYEGKVSFAWPLFFPIIAKFREAGKQLGIAVEFGADWKKFRDGPHVQLSWAKYP